MAKYEVTEMIASDVYVECPKCQERIDGWCGCDPRGTMTTCDVCGAQVTIHKEADIEMR